MPFPESYRCKISFDLMRDPVVDPDGNSYERSEIETWLRTHPVSPLTRSRLTIDMLKPNRALKDAIEEFLATHPRALSDEDGTSVLTPSVTQPNAFTNAPLTVSGSTYTVNGQSYLAITVAAPEDGTTQPLDLIVFLDTSGSMITDVVSGEGLEQKRIPRIFLAKHGLRVLAALLGSQHRLSVVTFSSVAKVVLPFTYMNAEGLKKVDRMLENVIATGQTNMWDAVRTGLTLAEDASCRGRHLVAMMFTDGEPTVEPPKGTLETIQGAKSPTNPWTLHTFGFGSQLDSDLLVKIAQWGGGRFGFIPSGDMLGTVFINAVANRLSVAHRGATVTCTPSSGPVVTIQTGPVRFGQPRHFVVPATGITYTLTCEGCTVTATVDPSTATSFVEARRDYLNLLQIIQGGFVSVGGRIASEAAMEAFVRRWAPATEDRIQALVRDLRSSAKGEGQVSLALNYATTWGPHYVRSYTMAQGLEECMNFKDPGLQIYGGASFTRHQDAGDKLFVTLPPMAEPVPLNYEGDYGVGAYGGGTVPVQRPVINMTSYHDPGGSCFTGDTLIVLESGERMPAYAIRRGDRVKTIHRVATVEYAIKFCNDAATQKISRIGALGITPWHPIITEQGWTNPDDLVGHTEEVVPALYNFVLSDDHVVNAGGHWCCTLGHEFKGPGIYHAFFGSRDKILDALSKQPGFDTGRPVYRNCVGVVDAATNLIVGWVDK